MIVEFRGGPLDGEVMEIPDHMREWRVPMVGLPEIWQVNDSAECLDAMLDAMRFGTYAPIGKPTEFHWRGRFGDNTTRDERYIEKQERALLAKLQAKYGAPLLIQDETIRTNE